MSRRLLQTLRSGAALTFAIGLVAAGTLSALGAEPRSAEPSPLWREVWSGADATPHVWLTYSGATIALGSRDVWSDGFWLRAEGCYGGYSLAVSGPMRFR